MKKVLIAFASLCFVSCAHAEPPAAPTGPTFTLTADEMNTAAAYLVKRRDEIAAEYQKIDGVLKSLQKQIDDLTKKAKENADAKQGGS